jgi:hypothetical protein
VSICRADQPRFFRRLWEWREIPAKRNGASQNDARAKAQQNCASENHDGMVTVAAKSHRQEKDSKQQHSLRQDPKSTSLVKVCHFFASFSLAALAAGRLTACWSR